MKLLVLAIIFAAGFVAGQYLIESFDITGYVSAITGTIQGLINTNSSSVTVATCTTNTDCNSTTYCNLESCGGSGVCIDRPETCPSLWDPVCGCDSRTYNNACLAASYGITIASEGSC